MKSKEEDLMRLNVHVDDVINDPSWPAPLRNYLRVQRLPAIHKMEERRKGNNPQLWATYNGKWVRVVMASRMGDVGISKNLDNETGYTDRVCVSRLENFRDYRPRFKREGRTVTLIN